MEKWFSYYYDENGSELKKEFNSLEDFPASAFGFVYMITHKPTGKAYVGKKALHHNITKKLTKKELAEQSGPGRKSNSKVIQKESDWKTYYGSAKAIVERIKEGHTDEFEREILVVVPNKKLLTYYETKMLFMLGVLEDPNSYFNDNILGKFYTKDFII